MAMSKTKKVVLALAAGPLIALLVFLHYHLPSTRKLQITGTDVKRLDVASSETGAITGRDVRFINTRDPLSGETYVYRNEDTRWGWPPYFKFDSGDLAGDALSVKESHPNATVLVTYYGWRIPFLDMYPNAVDLEIVDPRYSHIPWFNIFFVVFLFGGTGFSYYKLRKGWRSWRERRRERKAAKVAAKGTLPAERVEAGIASEERAPESAAEG